MMRTLILTAICLWALMAVGCASKHVVETPPAPMGAPEPEAVVRQRVKELRVRLITFSHDADELNRPNVQSDTEYRSRMQKVLVGFEESIPLVTGSERARSVDQDLGIVEDAQWKLVNGSMDLQADPTVDDALRAVYRALVRLDHDMFGDMPALTAVLDHMGARMRELDAAQGPQARIVARQGAEDGRVALWEMEKTLADRVGEGLPAATAPTTAPASDAAVAPATAPEQH